MNMSKLTSNLVVHPAVVVQVDVHVHLSAGDGAPMPPRGMLPWNMPQSWCGRILVLVLATCAAFVGQTGPALATLDYGFTGSFGQGVDKTPPGGNVCTVASGEECGPGEAGSGTDQFKEPAGVAINRASGDVYVVDQANNRVQKFDASGNPENFSDLATNVLNGTPTETFSLAGLFSGTGGRSASDSTNGITVDNSCYYHEPLSAAECKTSYPSNGAIYVIDTGHNVIDKFGEAGEYVGQLTGTCPSAGACSASEVVPFSHLRGVAVDPKGDLWVYSDEPSSETGIVARFNDATTNEFVSSWPTEFETSPGFAVDSADNVYVLKGEANFLKFGSMGESLLGETGCECGTGLAVDGSNDLYVDEKTKVVEYGAPVESPEPLPIREFGEERLANGSGIAVSASGAVYVADSTDDNVDIFELGEPPEETPVTEPASSTTATTALLQGTLKPSGTKIGYRFDYNEGSSCTGGVKTALKEGEGPVSEEVRGLRPATQYTFCLVAENAYGHRRGSEEAFTTHSAVEGVSRCAASGVTSEAATLEASLEPKGALTEYYFQYGTSLPGLTTTAGSSASVGVVTDSEPITRLEPNKIYECQLQATREIEGKPYTTAGEVGTFKTPALTPTVIGESASNVSLRSATLQTTIDPENSTTTYYIEYVEATSYCPSCADPYERGTRTPSPPASEGEVGGDLAYHTVQQTVEGLASGTSYDYRVVATNSPEPGTGTTDGENQNFTTAGESAPVATTGVAGDVTQNNAIVSGTINPEGYATNYVLELGTTSAYGTQIPGPVGSGNEAQAVIVTLEGLAPETTYHYRLSAANRNGTSYGADEQFTTTPNATGSLLSGLPATPVFVPTPIFLAVNKMTTIEPKALRRAQKLARALKTCRTKSKGKRAGCERRARKEYAPAKTGTKETNPAALTEPKEA